MNKFVLLTTILLIAVTTYANGVDTRYLPYGYIHEDTIHPYYVKLTSDYFKKVDSGQIKCDYKTYRKEVEEPLSKIIDRLKRGELK